MKPHPSATLLLCLLVGCGPSDEDRATHRNRLRMGAVLLVNFASENGGHAPASAAYVDERGTPLLSWRVAVLPNDMRGALALDEPWDSDANKRVLEAMPTEFESPGVERPGYTTLMLVTGPHTRVDGQPENDANPRTDGPLLVGPDSVSSNGYLLVFGPPEKAVPWTKPADLDFDPGDPLACLRSIPEEGLLAITLDGKVETIPPDIDPEAFRKRVSNDGK